MDIKPSLSERGRGTPLKSPGSDSASKKTRGRVKIKMEFIDNKLRRYTTFSKRKTGIMKKVSYHFTQIISSYSLERRDLY